MKPRNTLILLAVFALLAAYVFLIEKPKTQEQLSAQLGTPTAKPPLYVFQLTASDVTSLSVRDLHDGRELKVSRTENGWQMVKPIQMPADPAKLEQGLGRVATLQATRVLTNVSDIKAYGFVTPTYEIRIEMKDGTPYAIVVGDKTPDSASYYVTYTGDTKQVFVIDTFIVDGLKAFLDNPSSAFLPTPVPTATPTQPVTPSTDASPPAGTATPKP